MTKLVFYCDESGAKGYADQSEAFPGEVGVFAGIMLPDELASSAAATFNSIATRYTPSSGKLHIAELPPERQQALRDELFNAIRQWKLPCFWYAIHVAGFRARHVAQESLAKKLLAVGPAVSGPSSRYKRGRPRPDRPSLHVALFEGLYSHLIAFLIERQRRAVVVEVRTDQVDSPIVERFEEVAKDLLSDQPLVGMGRAFDTVKNEVVSRTVTVAIHLPDDLKVTPVVKALSISTVPDSDGLVLAVDVLANSLNFLFKSRGADDLYKPLNRREAVGSHPLADHLDAFFDWGAGDFMGDAIYRHPLASI